MWGGSPRVPAVELVFAKQTSAPGVPAQELALTKLMISPGVPAYSSAARICGVGCPARMEPTLEARGLHPGPRAFEQSEEVWGGSAGAATLSDRFGQTRLYPYSAGAESPFAGHHYRAQTFRPNPNDFPFVFSFSAGAASLSDRFGQTRLFCRLSAGAVPSSGRFGQTRFFRPSLRRGGSCFVGDGFFL